MKILFKLEGITRIDDTPVHKAIKEMIMGFLASRGSSKSSDIAAYIGLSLAGTRAVLAMLTEEGIIFAEGEGRLRKY